MERFSATNAALAAFDKIQLLLAEQEEGINMSFDEVKLLIIYYYDSKVI